MLHAAWLEKTHHMEVAVCVLEVQTQGVLRLAGRDRGAILGYVKGSEYGEVEERCKDCRGPCSKRENGT